RRDASDGHGVDDETPSTTRSRTANTKPAKVRCTALLQTTRAPSLVRFVTIRDRRPRSTSGEDAGTTVAPKLKNIEIYKILMEPELSDIWRAGSWRWLGGWTEMN